MYDESIATPRQTLSGDSDSSDVAVINARRVGLLYGQGAYANLGTFSLALISTVVLWPVIEHRVLVVWIALVALLSVLRALLLYSYRVHSAAAPRERLWLNLFTAGAAASGTLWGTFGLFLSTGWPVAAQAYVYFTLAGMSAAAIPAYSASMRVLGAYLLPMLLPVVCKLLYQAADPAYAGMGIAVLVYLVIVWYAARRYGESLLHSLYLRHRNDDLVHDLTAANNALLAEAGERKSALHDLRNSEQRLRDLVEGSIQGILIHRDWKPLFVNQAFADMLGFGSAREVLTNASLEHMFSVYEVKHLHTYPGNTLKDRQSLVKYEAEAVRSDGSRVILQCLVRSILWEQLPAIQISVVDITDLVRTTQALEAVEETYQRVFSTVTDATILFDAESLQIVDANPAGLALYGYDWSEMLNLRATNLVEDPAGMLAAIARARNGTESPHSTDRHRHKTGRVLPVEISVSLIQVQDQQVLCAIIRDVSARQESDDALRESEERFRVFAETAADFFWETDTEPRYTYVSERYEEFAGLSPEVLLGLDRDPLSTSSVRDEQYWRDHQDRLHNRAAFQDFEVSWIRPDDGTVQVLRNSAKPMFDKDNNFIGYRGVVRNVTEAHNLSEQLSYQAGHDALTGLVNRAEFENRMQQSIEHLRLHPSTHALCYLDLDQFKLINDTCGHAAGDELLRQVASLLSSRVRRSDTLARLGGDEFAILMENCSLDKAHEVADSLRQGVEDFQFLWDNKKFTIGVSIGMVPIVNPMERFEDILRAADSACYAAKDGGRNRVHIYHPEDEELAKREGEMQWVTRINAAFEEDRFELYYQRIAPASERPAEGDHYELLLRLRDADGSHIPPGAFLPAAERYNLMTRIDRWVVSTAVDWLQSHNEHHEQLALCAINLSGLTLGNEEFLAFVTERLRTAKVDPSKLCFEITETATIANLASATRFINELCRLGCHFALDDFGSGLSSFAYLKHLPVEYLKIDGLFVRDIADDPIDYAMVKSINEIGKVMGKRTIAEFVENKSVARKLEKIGVDYLQGNYIGVPAPLDELL